MDSTARCSRMIWVAIAAALGLQLVMMSKNAAAHPPTAAKAIPATSGDVPQAWQKEVVYQIYPRSFADGNGDGIGDIRGITSKVDYLKALGVDMVWLCPVNRSTNYDNGYDVTDYLDIDSTFGSLADWEALRDALHARGIKIMMDLVLNHTSDAHPWFLQEARLKRLRHLLPQKAPAALNMGDAAFRAAMQALLRQRPLPKGIDPHAEPFASLIGAVSDLRKGTERACELGYPSFAEQMEDTLAWLFGTPQARQKTELSNRDFYIWRDKPNNWTSIFSGSAWHFVEDIGAHYLALFTVHQPDLNWNNAQMRRQMERVVETWVQRGVDGFRLDSVAFIAKDQRYLDAPSSDTARMGRGLQYFVNQPEVHDYLKALQQHAIKHTGIRSVGEVTFSPVEVSLQYAGYNRQELTEVFLFDHMYVDIKNDKWDAIPLQLKEFKRVIGRQQAVIHNRAWVANYLENHDQLRAVSRFGNDKKYRSQSASMLATLLLTLEGTPYIYQGQEIGMTNGNFSRIEEVDDIEARNFYAAALALGDDPQLVMSKVSARNRDNVRTVMQWDSSQFAGFSQHQPWTKVNANYKEINVSQSLRDPSSVLNNYVKLIALRKKYDVFVAGAYQDLLPNDEHIYAYTRTLGSNKIAVILNFSNDPQAASLDLTQLLAQKPTALYYNYSAPQPPTPGPLFMQPWEARIYANF